MKRIFAFILLVFLSPALIAGPLPFSFWKTAAASSVLVVDTFTRSNANPISNPMSDGVSTWTTTSLDGGTSGVLQIAANKVSGTTAGNNFALVATPSIGTKQYAEFTVDYQGGSEYNGPMLYGQAGGTSDCYIFMYNGSATTILMKKRVSGTNTTLQTWTVASAVAGDKVRARVDPSTHTFTLSINGSDQSPTVVDTTYTSGQPGLFTSTTGTKMRGFAAGTW